MTDRIRHLTVTLSRDTRDDDAAPTIAAILMLRGVAKVEAGVVDVPELIARSTVASEIESEIHRAVHAIVRGESYAFEPKK